ncbi:MAG: hypothetical protein KKD31_17120 [Bacteroidetes bacterium]|nr:hypothetical protein [Bacteroidota bacterium]
MKVIISHDVDHLTVGEHAFRDGIITKFVVRFHIELFAGKISFAEYFLRVGSLLRNKWQHIEELIEYNKEMEIPATFFFGMNQGKNLQYSKERASPYIKMVVENGFDAGVHGIAYNDVAVMNEEYENFRKISGVEQFGIRMHYLRNDMHTLQFMEECGYKFDSSIMEFSKPYKRKAMWEFPLHVMDGVVMCGNRRWQVNSSLVAIEETKQAFFRAKDGGLPYFTILFHDRYFSNAHKSWKDWYVGITQWLAGEGVEFVSFLQAVTESENKTEK